jgi:streptogramin lyase
LGLVFALSSLVASCAQQPPAFAPAAAEERVERITQIPLPGSGYIYDVAVADGAVWVTSQAGLLRVDPVTSEMLNVLPHDYLFRVFPGYEDLWITTGSLGQVLRFDPQTSALVDIDIGAGPVTYLAVSEDAVWVSAVSDLVRIDPATNEVADRLRSERPSGTSPSALEDSGPSPARELTREDTVPTGLAAATVSYEHGRAGPESGW